MTSSVTSSSSGTISSLGVGSGLDANSIVSKLVEIERQPISNLQTAATKIQTKISEFGKVQAAVPGEQRPDPERAAALGMIVAHEGSAGFVNPGPRRDRTGADSPG